MSRRQRQAEFDPGQYDAIPRGYYDLVYQRGKGMQWFWHRFRFDAVTTALPDSVGWIVDLGCGPGTFLGNLRRPFARAMGIDIAAAQIEYAKAHYSRPGLEFRAGDVTVLDPGTGFDTTVSIEVVEHLRPEDARAFFAMIYELLNPGGTLVLTTPNYRSFWPVLEWLVSKVGPVDYLEQHINRYDRRRLCIEVAEAGFVDVRCRTFFFVAPFLAAISGSLAERVLRWESKLLPSLGAELLLVARKPG